MINKTLIIGILHLVIALGSLDVRPKGWLDRIVVYFRNEFIEDLLKTPHVNIKASIERAEPGYQDSPQWDYLSAMRLLVLIRKSPGNDAVFHALRRCLGPSRRFMSYAQSLKAFPSLSKDNINDFYYDIDSIEDDSTNANDQTPDIDDDSIIYVRNPVEARLPSARISVKLLRNILENRAKANRYMPSSTGKTITWKTTSKKPKDNTTATTDMPDQKNSSATTVLPTDASTSDTNNTVPDHNVTTSKPANETL